MAEFQGKFQELSTGIRTHYISEGEGVPLVLIHGWPDCWFGWRHQINPLKKAGYRVIVPDMRGFGQTSAPTQLEGYSLKSLTNDLIALLNSLNIQSAVFIGHDHGGSVAWRMCLHHPSRVIAVASICTPYTPPNKNYVSVQQIAKLWPSFQYQVYFNDGDAPINEFQTNVPRTIAYFLRGAHDVRDPDFKLSKTKGPLLPPRDIAPGKLLNQAEYEYYVQQFKTSGFAGNLNYYRTHQINYKDEKDINPLIHLPALMITAGQDFVLLPAMTKKMEQFVPNLTRGHVQEGNHWVLQEYPDRVNSILIDWLRKTVTTSKL